MHTRFIATTVALAALLLPALAHAAPKIVAVFKIEDRSGRFGTQACSQLTEYLAAQLAKGATFRVVPQAQLRARMKAKKKESYRKCVAEQCQIAIGRELAAQKSLATRIVQIGSKCAVMSTLYDLKTAASEQAATAKAACNQDALVTALENVARELRTSQASGAAPTPKPKPPAPAPTPEPKVDTKADPKPAGGTPPTPAPERTVKVGKPWYSSWWFWGIITLAITGAVVGILYASGGGESDETSSGPSALRQRSLGQPLFRF